jgi:hypothetical protein
MSESVTFFYISAALRAQNDVKILKIKGKKQKIGQK